MSKWLKLDQLSATEAIGHGDIPKGYRDECILYGVIYRSIVSHRLLVSYWPIYIAIMTMQYEIL